MCVCVRTHTHVFDVVITVVVVLFEKQMFCGLFFFWHSFRLQVFLFIPVISGCCVLHVLNVSV